MRFYGIANMYMCSGIHSGIQCGHAMGEIFNKYARRQTYADLEDATDSKLHDMVWDWSLNHKTWMVLNGGYASNLRRIIDIFKAHNHNFPWAKFHEDPDALDGALTAIGIILPDWIYDCQRKTTMDGNTVYYSHTKVVQEDGGTTTTSVRNHHPGSEFYELIDTIKSLKLAS